MYKSVSWFNGCRQIHLCTVQSVDYVFGLFQFSYGELYGTECNVVLQSIHSSIVHFFGRENRNGNSSSSGTMVSS